jgi:hypothetical protein
MGVISFYDGDNGSRNLIQEVEDMPGQNFRPRNDETFRSCILYSVRPGCAIALYHSPDGDKNDDYCIVNVKKSSPEYTVNSFERNYEDDYVVVSYSKIAGVYGQISRIKIN